MTANAIITKADYNNIRAKVINVLGVGTSNTGYNQLVKSAAVTESTKVSVNEWANLRYDIINCYVHQTGTSPSIVQPTVENIIASNLTSPDTVYNSHADTISTEANRFRIHSSQAVTTVKSSGSTTWPGAYGTRWIARAFCTITVSFTTAANARQFFNCGGQIRVASAQSGGSAIPQNTSWRSLLLSSGTVAFGGALPNTGTESNDGTNYFRCSNTFQRYYNASASNPYSSNNYRLSARTPDVVDNSNGTASTIEILVEFLDGHVGDGGGPDSVDGTFSVSTSTYEAVGVLQPAISGNFTVESPTVTVGAIQS